MDEGKANCKSEIPMQDRRESFNYQSAYPSILLVTWQGDKTDFSLVLFRTHPILGNWVVADVQEEFSYQLLIFRNSQGRKKRDTVKKPHKLTKHTSQKASSQLQKIKTFDLNQDLREMCSTSSGQLSQLNIWRYIQENKPLTFQKGSKTSSQ